MPGPVEVPPGFSVVARGAVASTQDELRALAADGAPDGTVVWAESQVSGRGRQARHWDSPPGNLYLSLLVRTSRRLAEAAQLSFVTVLAVADALATHVPGTGRLALKWPNDVLLDGAKVSGILLEAAPGDGPEETQVLIGSGVNLASHPAGTAYPATDLAAAGAGPLTPGRLLGDYLSAFAGWRRTWDTEGFGPVRAAWLDRAAGLGGPVSARVAGRTLEGTFAALDERGALVLETEAGERHVLTAGDVFVG